MGHLALGGGVYAALRRRLDEHPSALPDTPAIRQLLRLIFTEEEAAIACKLPFTPTPLETLARRLGEEPARLRERLERMAERGLIFDLTRTSDGAARFCLAPSIVGFFEMSLMRARDDGADGKIARLLYEHFLEDRRHAARLFGGETQIGRTLANEDALPADCEVLSYERASSLIREAGGGGVSRCFCRHAARHAGRPCTKPEELCMTLLPGAEAMIRHGHARRLSAPEMLDLLARAREAGLVQIADNVKRHPTYICNCCGCCCGQIGAINRLGIAGAVKTSGFLARIDDSRCVGCGRCARRCPIGAIRLEPRMPPDPGRGRLQGVVDEAICLGCGLCVAACGKEALRLERRKERVLTPESTLERVLRMAVERGKLGTVLFDDPTRMTNNFARHLVNALLSLPPARFALASRQVRSRLVEGLMSVAKSRGVEQDG